MRVKISYSVDLEDVPKHVAKLLSEAKQCLMDSSSSLATVLVDLEDNKGALEIVESLHNLRQKLFSVDTTLSDVGEILVGYEGTLLNQKLSQIPEDPQEEEESDE